VETFDYDDFAMGETKLTALGTGYFPGSNDPPSGLVRTIEWTANTLVDTSEDWVDAAVKRQWPRVMQSFNPLLPSDIDEADVSAISTLVEVGRKMAAAMDWKQILG
jgi:hypothetical protein